MPTSRFIIYRTIRIFLLLSVSKASTILSTHKPTSQSSIYSREQAPLNSSLAVDGITKHTLRELPCSHQLERMDEAWWWVDLGRPVTIKRVKIYYRRETDWEGWKNRFAGYEIYLSNTTERHREDLCYCDNTPDVESIRSIVDHECRAVARYVILYNDRRTKKYPWYDDWALLELCEVQVYGCDIGKYGKKCGKDCPNCKGRPCDPDTGSCEECEDGFFGETCGNVCGHCIDKKCGKSTGKCATPCLKGWTGHACDIQVLTRNSNDTSYVFYIVAGVFILVTAAILLMKEFSVFPFTSNEQESPSSDYYSDAQAMPSAVNRDLESDAVYEEIEISSVDHFRHEHQCGQRKQIESPLQQNINMDDYEQLRIQEQSHDVYMNTV